MAGGLSPEIQSMIMKLVSRPSKGVFKLYKNMVETLHKTNEFDAILLTPFFHHFTAQRFVGFGEDTFIEFFSALFAVLRRISPLTVQKPMNFILTIVKSFLAPTESRENTKNAEMWVYITPDVKYGAIKCVFVLLKRFCAENKEISLIFCENLKPQLGYVIASFCDLIRAKDDKSIALALKSVSLMLSFAINQNPPAENVMRGFIPGLFCSVYSLFESNSNSICLVQAAKTLSRIVIIAFSNKKPIIVFNSKSDVIERLQKIEKNQIFEKSENGKKGKNGKCSEVAEQIGVRLNRLFDYKKSRSLLRDRFVYSALVSGSGDILANCFGDFSDQTRFKLVLFLAIAAESTESMVSAAANEKLNGIKGLLMFEETIQKKLIAYLTNKLKFKTNKIAKNKMSASPCFVLQKIISAVAFLSQTSKNFVKFFFQSESSKSDLFYAISIVFQPKSGFFYDRDIGEIAELAHFKSADELIFVERFVTVFADGCSAKRISKILKELASDIISDTSKSPWLSFIKISLSKGKSLPKPFLENLTNELLTLIPIYNPDSENDRFYIFSALNCLSLSTRGIGAFVTKGFPETLFPLLELLSSPSSVLQKTSFQTLTEISKNCGYQSLSPLLLSHSHQIASFFVNDFDAFRLNSNALTLLLSDPSIALSMLSILPEVVDKVFGHLSAHSLACPENSLSDAILFLDDYFRALLAYDMAVYKTRFGADYREAALKAEAEPLKSRGRAEDKNAPNFRPKDYEEMTKMLNSADFSRERGGFEAFPAKRDADAETIGKADAETDGKADAETDAETDAESNGKADAEIDAETDGEPDGEPDWETRRKQLDGEKELAFVKKQLMRMAPFCGSRSARAKLMALKIMAISLEILAGDEEHFLPAVADIWPFLKPLFRDRNINIASKASTLLCKMMRNSKTFLRQRFDDELWPILRQIISNFDTAKCRKVGGYRATMQFKLASALVASLNGILGFPDVIKRKAAEMRSVCEKFRRDEFYDELKAGVDEVFGKLAKIEL